MEKMTLSRALRYKKRVVETIRKLESDVQQNNTKAEGETKEVDVSLALKHRTAWVKHLTDLKLAIQEKTRPIQRLVFELAEAKAEIAFLSHLCTHHGMTRATYRDEVPVKYEATIRKSDQDQMVTALQQRIDDLQTRIDAHNAETTVELASPELP